MSKTPCPDSHRLVLSSPLLLSLLHTYGLPHAWGEVVDFARGDHRGTP